MFFVKDDLREAFTRGGQPCTPTKGRIQNTPKVWEIFGNLTLAGETR